MSNSTNKSKFKLVAAALSVAALLGVGYVVVAPQLSGGQIQKSPNDTRQYQYLTLNNGLRVILVEDKDAKFASAALNVDVGSLDEPKEWNGLVHLLEHALFLDSEKYPKVGEYQEFIRSNGGRYGAITEETYANFHFNIVPDHFEAAFDRFAQFFNKPLFNPEGIEKEIQAVDAEFKQSAKQDSRRVNRVYSLTSNPESAYHQFQFGNLDTLKDKPEQKTVDALKDFYAKNYSADKMSLVVVSPQPLAELKKSVTEKFSTLPKIAKSKTEAAALVYTPNETGVTLSVDPEGAYHEVSLRFPFPRDTKDGDARTYVAHMLSQGEKQGLHSILKSLGWVTNMNAFVYALSREQNEFTINYQLTKEGAAHIDEVTAFTFQYIDFLKKEGIKDYLFKELVSANEMVFRSTERNDELTHAVVLSNNLFEYEPSKAITGAYILKDNKFQPKQIENILGFLRPDNMRRIVILPQIMTDKKDDLYNVQYAVEKLSKSDIDSFYIAQLPVPFELPKANIFMPTKFDVKSLATSDKPEVISENKRGKLWYMGDSEFKTAKADWVGIIRSPIAYDTKKHVILTGLYTLLVADTLYPNDYSIGAAGAKYSMFNNQEGITVAISGFSDKLDTLSNLVFSTLKNLKVDENAFANIKQRLKDNWSNTNKAMLFQRAVNDVNTLLVTPNWRPNELLSELDGITSADLEAFIAEFNKSSQIEMLAYGNLTNKEASAEFNHILETFYGKTENEAVEAPPIKVVQIPASYNYQWIVEKNDQNEKDSVLAQYFQAADTSAASIAKSLFLGQVMGAPFYNQLKNVEQVGLQVGVQSSVLNDVSGLLFVVQSPNNDSAKIQARVNNFITSFEASLKALTDEDFTKLKSALVTALNEKPKNLNEKTFRLWQEISMRTYRFDRQAEVSKALEALTKEDVVNYYQQMLLNPETKRELVSLTSNGPRTLDKPRELKSAKDLIIEDVQRFKQDATYFGS